METDHNFFDYWSIVHFIMGVLTFAILMFVFKRIHAIARRPFIQTGLVISTGVLLHQAWEYYENSPTGIHMWNKLGWDYEGDSINNTIGDPVFFTMGNIIALFTSLYAA
jgi:hypothetical protein